MEFEEMINRIVSNRIEQELSKLEVKIYGYESSNDGLIHVHTSIFHKGRCLTSCDGIIMKLNG